MDSGKTPSIPNLHVARFAERKKRRSWIHLTGIGKNQFFDPDGDRPVVTASANAAGVSLSKVEFLVNGSVEHTIGIYRDQPPAIVDFFEIIATDGSGSTATVKEAPPTKLFPALSSVGILDGKMISFALGRAVSFEVSVFDAQGKSVCALARREARSGMQAITLPPTLSNGAYFLRVEADGMLRTVPFVRMQSR